MFEIIFLSVIAIVWLSFAVVQDLKKREIANWLNFSLIAFALGFRLFYSLFYKSNFLFFYQGIFGLAIFFILGNALYYGKFFAGGDAKLLIALGTVLPFSESFSINLSTFLNFFLIFFFTGAVYSLTISIILSLGNFSRFKKEFGKQFRLNKKIHMAALILSIVTATAGILFDNILVLLGIFIFIIPYIYTYAKAVDESFMIKEIKTGRLTEGDWLYHDIKLGKKTIKATWHGLTKNEISLIKKKYKKVSIRQGIPFSPVFLIAFILLLILRNIDLSGVFV